MQGEIIADLGLDTIDKNGNGKVDYIMIEGDPENVDAKYRTEFSVKALEDAGLEVNQLDDQVGNWDQATAQQLVANDLSQFGDDVEVVFCNNDAMALGAIDALRESHISREDWPGVVGIDGTEVGLNAVKNGDMLGTVYNDKEGQAREMLNLAFAIATSETKKDIPLIDGKYVRTPYHKVTLDNIEDYE